HSLLKIIETHGLNCSRTILRSAQRTIPGIVRSRTLNRPGGAYAGTTVRIPEENTAILNLGYFNRMSAATPIEVDVHVRYTATQFAPDLVDDVYFIVSEIELTIIDFKRLVVESLQDALFFTRSQTAVESICPSVRIARNTVVVEVAGTRIIHQRRLNK